jgi:hypothetical protein
MVAKLFAEFANVNINGTVTNNNIVCVCAASTTRVFWRVF